MSRELKANVIQVYLDSLRFGP